MTGVLDQVHAETAMDKVFQDLAARPRFRGQVR